MNEGIEIRPEALVVHPINGLVITLPKGNVPDLPGFWLTLGPGAGHLWFGRVAKNREVFRSLQWQLEPDPTRGPQASVQGVLWSRRAAHEANQAIASYLRVVGPSH